MEENDKNSNKSAMQIAFEKNIIDSESRLAGRIARDKEVERLIDIEYERCKRQLASSGEIIPISTQSPVKKDKSSEDNFITNYDHSLEMDRLEALGFNIKNRRPHLEDSKMRPVERDGKISFEVHESVTIDDLLKNT